MSKKILTYGSLQTTIRNVVPDATFPSGANLNKCVTTVAALAYGTNMNGGKLTMSSTHPNNCLVSAEDLTITAKTVTPPATVTIEIPVQWVDVPDNIVGEMHNLVLIAYTNEVTGDNVQSQAIYVLIPERDTESTLTFTMLYEDAYNMINRAEYIVIRGADEMATVDWEGIIYPSALISSGSNYICNERIMLTYIGLIPESDADLELCYTSATSRLYSGRGVNIEWVLEDASGNVIVSGFEPFNPDNVEPWVLSRGSSTVCFMVRPIAGLLSYDECIDMGYGEPVLRITAHIVSTSTGTDVGQATVEATWNGFFWHVQI